MEIVTCTPIYSLSTPDGGRILLSHPAPESQLALRQENGHYQLPAPIIGYARLDEQLTIYTAGTMPAQFRTAAEEGCEMEYFFGKTMPQTLAEYRLDEYAPQDLLYFPPQVQASLMIAHVNAA